MGVLNNEQELVEEMGWLGKGFSGAPECVGKGEELEGRSVAGEGRARGLGDLGFGDIRSSELTIITVG